MPLESQPTAHKTALESFKETIESLILAFILAFVFRAFVVEAFVIPTGSMADTLRGAHFRLTCPTCAFPYNVGFMQSQHRHPTLNRSFYENEIPAFPISVAPQSSQLRDDIPICPMCGAQIDTEHPRRVSNGDRILVQKYIYHFRDPDTWDVVVFKNPTDPTKNFIKRLVGRPGETILIRDGDIYLDGHIQRKPPHVQDVLWLEAYNLEYEPPTGRGKDLWQPALQPAAHDTAWRLDEKFHRLEFDGSPVEQDDVLRFNPDRLRYIVRNFCAYNGPRFATDTTSIVSDLKFAFILIPTSEDGSLAVQFTKYGRPYTGQIDFDGRCTIFGPDKEIFAEERFDPLIMGQPVGATFSVVDHRLEICLGDEVLRWDGPDAADAWGYGEGFNRKFPTAALIGHRGAFTLESVRLYRDTHYSNVANGHRGRATEETGPFKLAQDEFFVLGDNSPASHDSRFWIEPGLGNGDTRYSTGVVPRDYLIGRAFFVYWPAGFHFPPNFRIALIPNVGQMRFIH